MSLITISNGSGYTTAAKARVYAGLSQTTDVSDSDLNAFIVQASRTLHSDIAIRHFNARCTGTIDGSNTVFILPHPYIADRDLDSTIDTTDLVVRTGTRDATTDAITRAVVSVSSVDETRGAVTLAAAPATTVDFVEVDYDRYLQPVYLDQLEEATNALVAHLVYERMKSPDKVTLAQLRGQGAESGPRGGTRNAPSSKWLARYQELVRRIRAGDLTVGDRDDINA